MDTERRTFNHKVELRAVGDKKKIVGYGAVFNSLSENLGGFREIIDPGAFDAVLNDPHTRGLYNHSSNMVLGRNLTTMNLSVDETGLRYEIDPPNTTFANDLLISMARGDVDQSSFQFTVEKDDWKEDEDGRVIRTIEKVGRLIDVSPVTFPAYPEASSDVRGLMVAKRKLTEFLGETKDDNSNLSEQRISELENQVLLLTTDLEAKEDINSRLLEQVILLKKFQ